MVHLPAAGRLNGKELWPSYIVLLELSNLCFQATGRCDANPECSTLLTQTCPTFDACTGLTMTQLHAFQPTVATELSKAPLSGHKPPACSPLVLDYSRLGPNSVSLMKAPKEPPSGLLWASAGAHIIAAVNTAAVRHRLVVLVLSRATADSQAT